MVKKPCFKQRYNQRRVPHRALPALMLAVGALPAASPAVAQQSGMQALEEVVVTAQRREANLQDTPIAITAFSSDKLDALGVYDVSDIGAFAPNVVIEQSPNTNAGMTIFIRGIGTSETALMADPKIGLYIDDIYVSKTMGAVFDIADIERIEVLRGPQGTLFGRNTTGGAITVTTAKPTGEFDLKADASFGRWDLRRYGLSMNLPEVANVSAKISWHQKRVDGWAKNEYDGPPIPPADRVVSEFGSQNDDAWRLALRWAPTDTLLVDYSYDRTDNDGSAPPFQTIAVKDYLYDGFTTTPFPYEFLGGEMYQQMAAQVGDPTRRQTRFSMDGHTEGWLEVEGHALTVAWDLEPITLKYIFGHRETQWGYAGADYGGAYIARDAFYGGGAPVPTPEFSAGVLSDMEMTTHEFQIFGSALSDRLNYTAGAFFYKEDIFQDQPQTFALPIIFLAGNPDLFAAYDALGFCEGGLCIGTQRLPLPFGVPGADPNFNGVQDFSYGQEMESWAVYGQVSYDFTDALTVTAGLRYTDEEREGFVFNEDFGHVTFDDRIGVKEDWSNVSGVLNFSYRLTDEMAVYAKYTRGFNGGGFNARSGSAAAFRTPADEEIVDAYELGVKSELFDRRVRLNMALFWNDYTDIQITQFEAGTGGASSRIVNAGEGVYQGFEADLLAVVADGLTVDLTYGYLDASFDEYVGINPATDQPEDISGITTVSYAPRHSAALGLQYEFPQTSYGLVSARVDVTYKDKFVFHPFQNQLDFSDNRTLVNARLSLSDIPLGGDDTHQLRVSLWAKNLTDEHYRHFGIDFGALGWAGALFGEPRSYGIDFRYEFN